jgi:hypothetical protein
MAAPWAGELELLLIMLLSGLVANKTLRAS